MLVYGTILALCALVINVQARNIEPGTGHFRDRCEMHSWTEVSCSNASSPDALLPYPDDCNLFYYCPHPALPPVCRQCPAGLHFSPALHVCDWPAQAGCNRTEEVTTTTTEAAEPMIGGCNGSEACMLCVNTTLSLVPHPDDCTSYYFCIIPGLEPLRIPCPWNWHFNKDTQTCEPADEAGCITTSDEATEAVVEATESFDEATESSDGAWETDVGGETGGTYN